MHSYQNSSSGIKLMNCFVCSNLWDCYKCIILENCYNAFKTVRLNTKDKKDICRHAAAGENV